MVSSLLSKYHKTSRSSLSFQLADLLPLFIISLPHDIGRPYDYMVMQHYALWLEATQSMSPFCQVLCARAFSCWRHAFSLSLDLVRSYDYMVIWFYWLKLFKVSHHPAMFCGYRDFGNRDDQVIKEPCQFMYGTPL